MTGFLTRLSFGGRPDVAIWLAGVVVIGAAITTVQPVTRMLDQAVIGSSSGTYLEIAASSAWCGRYPYVTSVNPANTAKVDLTNQVLERVADTSIRQVAIDGAGSLQDYCALTGSPFVM